MMSYIENQPLLQQLREADRVLRQEQADVRADTDSPLTRHIADHMRSWEEFLADTLEKLEASLDEATSKRFHQITPHGSPLERLQSSLPAPREPKELVTWTLKRHEELAEWCASVASQGVSDSTTEQFQLLADQLKDINRQLAADTRSLEQST